MLHEDSRLEDAAEKLCEGCPALFEESGCWACMPGLPGDEDCPRHGDYLNMAAAYREAAEKCNEILRQARLRVHEKGPVLGGA